MSWLDEDFSKSTDREYFLKECLSSKKLIPAGSVLQISQCINISVPRRNREVDPSLNSKNAVLRVTLTDGKSSAHGLLTEYHPKLTSTTLPGTKVEITSDAPIVMNFVVLTPKNVRVLGGLVPYLAEQWEMQIAAERMKSWGFRTDTQTGEGAPLWKPFSFRDKVDRSDLKGVKAMELVKEQQKDGKGDDGNKTKFEEQRQETISELAKQAQMKSFGEAKKLMDKGVLDIMNEGFSQQEAEEAMQRFKNAQKALKFLKGARGKGDRGPSTVKEIESKPRGKKGRGRDLDEDDGPTGNERGEQPSSNISLFGFIQDKIKTGDDSSANEGTKPTSGDSRYQGSDDYSQRNSDRDSRSYGGRGGRGGRGGDRGARYDHRSSQDAREFSNSDDFRGGRGRGGRGGGGDRRGRDYGSHYDDSGPPDGHRRQTEPRFSRNDRNGPPRTDYNSRSQNSSNYSGRQMSSSGPDFEPGFVNQASHFPSLGSEYPPPSAPRSEQPLPRSYHPQQPREQEGYGYSRNGNDRQNTYNQRRYQDGHQTYPGRGGGRGGHYGGYERTAARPHDAYPMGGDGRPAGPYYQGSPYDQITHQFSHMNMQGHQGDQQFSGDWRPSHTMVFTRSRGRGGGN